MNRATQLVKLLASAVLLFAVAGCTERQKGISVELANTHNPTPMPGADKADALVVTITKDNQLFLGADPLNPYGLIGKVKERSSAGVDNKVYIKADARARYGNVVEVLDEFRTAQVTEVGLLTKQRNSERISGGTEAVPPKGLEVLVADQPASGLRTIVVQVLKGFSQVPALKINNDDVVWGNLEERLSYIFNTRAEKVMFVEADEELPFAAVAEMIDMGHSAGAKVVVITSRQEQKPDSIPGQSKGVLTDAINGVPESVPRAATPQRVRVSQGVMQGLLVRKVEPKYPPLARNARIQGTVVLQALVGKDGEVQNLHVVSGHPMLVPAALDAVKQWRFKPYYLNGEPVEVESTINVNFSLQQ